jgi:hypothetical protein
LVNIKKYKNTNIQKHAYFNKLIKNKNMIKNIKNLAQSKTFKAIIITLLILAIVLGIFQAGIFVGFHKASFLFNSGDNFYKIYGERNGKINRGSMMGGIFRDEFGGGHGVVGKIIKINLPNIVVLGPDNIEKNILTNASTSIYEYRNNSSIEKLTLDKFVTVLGSPDSQGQIVAKFIRIIPSMPMMFNINNNTTNTK